MAAGIDCLFSIVGTTIEYECELAFVVGSVAEKIRCINTRMFRVFRRSALRASSIGAKARSRYGNQDSTDQVSWFSFNSSEGTSPDASRAALAGQLAIDVGAFAQYVNLHVDSIDEPGHQAVVSIHYDPFFMPHIPQLGGSVFGAVAVDGPGFIAINGKVIKIPPRGPIRVLVENAGRLAEMEDNGLVDQATSRQRAVHDIVLSVGRVARDFEVVSGTPPKAEQLRR